MNLHVFQVRLKQRKVSSHPPSLQGSNGGNKDAGKVRKFPHFQISGALIVIMSFCRILFQKSGTKSRGVFTFCTATAILHCTYYPALLPKCGIL